MFKPIRSFNLGLEALTKEKKVGINQNQDHLQVKFEALDILKVLSFCFDMLRQVNNCQDLSRLFRPVKTFQTCQDFLNLSRLYRPDETFQTCRDFWAFQDFTDLLKLSKPVETFQTCQNFPGLPRLLIDTQNQSVKSLDQELLRVWVETKKPYWESIGLDKFAPVHTF